MEASRSFTPYNGTRGWGLSVCLVFLGLCALAQQRLVFRHLSVSEGLPNNNIQWIATDGFGMVWIATENGLARFDGSVTDVYKPGDTDSYGPAGGQVHFVGTVPGTHAVWTGATTGLSRFDQKTGRWYRVPLLYNETLGAPLPTYVYPFHIDDRGCVWMYIGHYGSICRYFPHTGRVETVTPGSNGRVYTPDPLYMPLRYTVSTLVHGIYYADYRSGKPEEKKRFAADPGFSFFAERAWYPHPDTLWLATDRGLVRCNPSADTWEAYPFPSEVTALAPDRKRPRYLWLGTRNDGIYRFDIREGRADFHALHDPENPYSIRSNRVTFLHTDSLDRLFAGLEGKGLAYADLSRPAFYSDFTGSRAETRGLANTVTHIFRSKNGEYLSGTSGSGLLAFTRDGRFLRKIAGIPGERVYSGIYAGDRLLVQTDGGFASYRPSGGRAEKLETSAPSRLHVMGWAALPDGTLYAGTDLGLFRAETGPGRIRFLPVPAVNDLLDYAYIQYIHNEGNTVYLKTNYTDWLVLAYESGRFRLLKKCTNQNYVVNDLIPTPGRRRFLLAATSAGIKTWDTQALDWVDNAVCRLNENTVSLSYDPRTGLWAATDNGLFLYDTEEGGFERFGVENGLSSEQFTPAKGMPGRRWMVWGSVNGITRISADGAPDSARNPRWTVKSAYVGTQKVPSFTPLYFLDTLEVPAGASGFSMDVSIQGIRPDNGGYLSSRLWGVDAEHNGAVYAEPASDDVKSFASSLTLPYCGVNAGFEAGEWLEDASTVTSMAMIPLRLGFSEKASEKASDRDGAFGLLVLGSPDPTRYAAEMGTEFLMRIGEVSSAALTRLRLRA